MGRLQQVGKDIREDFIFGEFIDKPNITGVFKIKNSWFIYENDERNESFITGPFNDEDIVYACVKLMHKSKYFEEYRFSSRAKETYAHIHLKSFKEAEEKA